MATNGNIDYGNNGNAIPTKGVSSNIANRQAKREFSNQFWEPDIGYLAKATEELKNQNKAMLEILNTDTKLKKAQKDRLDLNLKENDRIVEINGTKVVYSDDISLFYPSKNMLISCVCEKKLLTLQPVISHG